MSDLFKRLQFFADGGAAGGEGGGAEGVAAADPGQQSLENLGVPKELAERHRARKSKSKPAAEPALEAQPEAEVPQEVEEAPAEVNSWDDFMKVPENNAKMQQIVSDRLKKQGKEHDAFMSKLSPALELLANKYGIESTDGRIDPEALAKAVMEDDSYYEDKAVELGVDSETAKHIVQLEQEKARADAERSRQERDAQLQQHFMALQQQANALQQIYPDFNLEAELQNPVFFQRTTPEGGMSVKEAFYSMHGDEIMQQQAAAIAQRAKVDAANSIRSGKHPRENGSSGSAPVSVTTNIHNMSREERLAYIQRKYAKPPE